MIFRGYAKISCIFLLDFLSDSFSNRKQCLTTLRAAPLAIMSGREINLDSFTLLSNLEYGWVLDWWRREIIPFVRTAGSINEPSDDVSHVEQAKF